MSQRREKTVRALVGRVEALALRLEGLENAQSDYIADKEFQACLAGVQRELAVEAGRQAGQRQQRQIQGRLRLVVWGLVCMCAIVCATILFLTVTVGGQPMEADKPGKRTPVVAEPVVVETAVASVVALNALENARITHYCACAKCCGKSDGITASGAVATEGVTVAVDPAVIPLGSWVRIGEDWYIAQDTGVSGGSVDVFVGDHQEALELGVRMETVWWVPRASEK